MRRFVRSTESRLRSMSAVSPKRTEVDLEVAHDDRLFLASLHPFRAHTNTLRALPERLGP